MILLVQVLAQQQLLLLRVYWSVFCAVAWIGHLTSVKRKTQSHPVLGPRGRRGGTGEKEAGEATRQRNGEANFGEKPVREETNTFNRVESMWLW